MRVVFFARIHWKAFVIHILRHFARGLERRRSLSFLEVTGDWDTEELTFPGRGYEKEADYDESGKYNPGKFIADTGSKNGSDSDDGKSNISTFSNLSVCRN